MTATELQSLARILSNQTWCRHWLNWQDRQKDVVMAIQCRDCTGKPERVVDLERLGFELWANADDQACQYLYVAPRTNDDGSPFESTIFT
jgi:hypothetical protein